MQTLTVVNTMLGTLGEAPLNALTDPHTFRGACIATLDRHDSLIQNIGWWFNREVLTIAPNIGDGKLYLPGDVVNVIVPGNLALVQRGRVLYDTVLGTNIFTDSVDALIIRRLAFEELPELAAGHVAAQAVLEFQMNYDADQPKSRVLAESARLAKTEFIAESIRQARVNTLDMNIRLQRLKSRIRRVRTI